MEIKQFIFGELETVLLTTLQIIQFQRGQIYRLNTLSLLDTFLHQLDHLILDQAQYLLSF